MGKQLRTFIEENRIAQHIIAFTMLLTLFMVFGNITNITQALAYTFIGYAWFLMSTKLDIQWNIILLVTLVAMFLYDSYLTDNEKRMESDPNIDKQIVKLYIEQNKNYRFYLLLTLFGIAGIGIFLYNNKKIEQYGGAFDLKTFIFY